MRLLVTVTFNENQLRSHLLPILAVPEVEEVVLVADALPPPLPKLRAVVPPRRLTQAVGRAGAKLVVCVRLARRLRPHWIVSYNVMPHGVNGYVAGRAAGSRTMYHMIGGAVEWEGGGWRSDNAILGRLPRPVPQLEAALLRILRSTTVVCAMGSTARARLLEAGIAAGRIAVVPPSVDTERFSPPPAAAPRPYDLVTVGELIPTKRLHDFLELVAALRARRPALRAAIAGRGPLQRELEAAAAARGIMDAVDFLGQRSDIESVYRAGRVFVLTSRWEGLSIAMTEAMSSGLPAVVTDVGDLRDLVRDGRNGHLVPVGDVDAFAGRVESLLGDDEHYARLSAAAREDAVAYASVARVSELYRELLVDGATP